VVGLVPPFPWPKSFTDPMRQPKRTESCTNVEALLTHGPACLVIVGATLPTSTRMPFVFDIPFRASHDEGWTIALPSGEKHLFPSRHEAVRFAAGQATRLPTCDGARACLSIEGEDGVWRLFGSDLKAPNL